MNQRGDALRMFGVSETFEEAVRCAQDGKSHFGPVDEGGEAFMMAFAGLAEEHSLDAASGTQCFFDEADALDSNEAVFRGQPAAQGDAKLLEPAIVAAGQKSRLASRARATSGFAGRCHHRGG